MLKNGSINCFASRQSLCQCIVRRDSALSRVTTQYQIRIFSRSHSTLSIFHKRLNVRLTLWLFLRTIRLVIFHTTPRKVWEHIQKTCFLSGSDDLLDSAARTIPLLEDLHRRPFAGHVFVNDDRAVATKHAQTEDGQNRSDRLVLWADGSYRLTTGIAGAAVVWNVHSRNQGHVPGSDEVLPEWHTRCLTFSGLHGSNDIELLALASAVKVATSICREVRTVRDVTIYSDSLVSLRGIRHFHLFPRRQREQYRLQMELGVLKARSRALQQMGINIELRWVPGHVGVAGNMKADTYAKMASLGGSDSKKVLRVRPGRNPLLSDVEANKSQASLEEKPDWIRSQMVLRHVVRERSAPMALSLRLLAQRTSTSSSTSAEHATRAEDSRPI